MLHTGELKGMYNEKRQQIRMAVSIACLVLISICVGGMAGTGNLAMTLWFAGVWLLVAPVGIKQIYDVKKSEQLRDDLVSKG